MASRMDGPLAEDLKLIEDELPPPAPADRPVQCRSYDCDWIGTARELVQRERVGPFRKVPGQGSKMERKPVKSRYCPQCERWHSDG